MRLIASAVLSLSLLFSSSAALAADNDPAPSEGLSEAECADIWEDYYHLAGRLHELERCPSRLTKACSSSKSAVITRMKNLADKWNRGRCDRF